MEKTKESKIKTNKKTNKNKEKPTIGDIIFRVLILLAIFFIVVIMYVFYIKQTKENKVQYKNFNNVQIISNVK